MTISLAPQTHDISPGETRAIAVDMTGQLDEGELLTGTPTIAEQTTSDLTITNKRVNTLTLIAKGRTLVAGQALQCTVTGAVAGKLYQILLTCGTNATYPQTVQTVIRLRGVAAVG